MLGITARSTHGLTESADWCVIDNLRFLGDHILGIPPFGKCVSELCSLMQLPSRYTIFSPSRSTKADRSVYLQ